MKKLLLIFSLLVIVLLVYDGLRETVLADYRVYQRRYRAKLLEQAKTPDEKAEAEAYPFELRQLVLPALKRTDRCISCHVGIEDPRMADAEQPLRTHPGNLLETHDIRQIGCTICHDGQGLATEVGDAHAQGEAFHWEKPLLAKPFIEANCYRCHSQPLEETPHYNRGKQTFLTKGCTGCHRAKQVLNGAGGTIGPELSAIGDRSPHVNAATPENRERLMKRFNRNGNLAYLYESIKDPKAQPPDSVMVDFHFPDDEIIDLMVFLKSLTSETVPPDFQGK